MHFHVDVGPPGKDIQYNNNFEGLYWLCLPSCKSTVVVLLETIGARITLEESFIKKEVKLQKYPSSSW